MFCLFQIERETTARAIELALAAADRSDFEAARSYLITSAAACSSTVLNAQIQSTLDCMESADRWRSGGGRAEASEMRGTVENQRAVYAKKSKANSAVYDYFQAPASASVQSKAARK